jgi:pyrimidine-specific ribonucleoside hydrolase
MGRVHDRVSPSILMDCDPGHDDAMALLLALASPEVELIGVTTVHGNQTIDKTTANALRILELAGRDEIPVAAGAAAPLMREPMVAASVHGETGLDGPDLPAAVGAPVAGHAVEFLAERLRRARRSRSSPPDRSRTSRCWSRSTRTSPARSRGSS